MTTNPVRHVVRGTARLVLTTERPHVVDAPGEAEIRDAFCAYPLPYGAAFDLTSPDGRVLGAVAATGPEMAVDDPGEFFLDFNDEDGSRHLRSSLDREATIALFTRFAAGDAGFLHELPWAVPTSKPATDPALMTTEAELRWRMEADARAYGGTLPREAIIAWEGYLAAMIEWGTLTVAEHARLCKLLPPIEDSPVTHILLGREEPHET